MEHTANPLVREVVLEVIEKWDKRIKKQEPSAVTSPPEAPCFLETKKRKSEYH